MNVVTVKFRTGGNVRWKWHTVRCPYGEHLRIAFDLQCMGYQWYILPG